MVTYHFAPGFEEPIRQGIKTQTIRRDALLRHARPGELITLCGGDRPHCVPILPPVPCLALMQVEISFAFTGSRLIDRIATDEVRVRDLEAFAIREGFIDLEDMSAFFHDIYPLSVKDGFKGVVVEWARPAESMIGVAA